MSVPETQGKQASNVGGCTANMHCMQARVYICSCILGFLMQTCMHLVGRYREGKVRQPIEELGEGEGRP